MLLWCCVLFFFFILTIEVKSFPKNDTAVLISTYAKVAHWGARASTSSNTTQNLNEGRSNSGQTLWTHRSDVNIIGGQNVNKKNPSVTYLYSVSKPTIKVDQNHAEILPAKGEIEERFNPRPYFEFSPYSKSNKNPSQDSIIYATPFTASPVYNKPSEFKNTMDDNLYNSPYSSYNPPDVKPDNINNDNFPPNGNPDTSSSPDNTYLPPPTDSAPSAPSNSYLPPSNDDMSDDFYKYPTNDNNPKDNYHNSYKYSPPDDDLSSNMDSQPPKSYMPSHNNHNVNNNDDSPITKDVEPPHSDKQPYLDYPSESWNNDYHNHNDDTKSHSMGEDDMSPPPPPPPPKNGDHQVSNYGHVPEYLDHNPKDHGYDFHDYDHHQVYHEVTTKAPEDMRVNKGHYSYYYLGRKLWYIPLYFSIYFIIYVTILILKSIARHKIEFKHQHFHDKQKYGRNLDINDVQMNVGQDIDIAREKFM